MLSLKSISAVKVAVEICHNTKLKVKILRAHKSENNEGQDSWVSESILKEIANIITSLDIPKNLQEELICLVSRIGMRMLDWAYYHEEILKFSRDHSIAHLTPSFFTSRGIVDRKKAAKELMDAKTLDTKQRYILACIYCFIKDVNTLFRTMTGSDKRIFYNARRHENIKQPEMVKYWTYYKMNKIYKLTNEDVNAYKIKTAVRSGNIAAVEYFLQDMVLGRETDAVVEAAMEAIRSWKRKMPVTRDWNAYLNRTYDKIKTPRSYFADIVCYLLSRMERSQKIEFLKRDIVDHQCKTTFLKYKEYSRVLQCLLNWPYQGYFMKTLEVMWGFLNEWDYAVLLLLISRKIEDESKEIDGEGKSFDYRRLLREVWCQSHKRYKMFVLNNREILCINDDNIKAGVILLINLIFLRKFTNEDKENVEIILADATEKQKENIIYSKEWEKNSINLIDKEKWGMLSRIDMDCFFTKKSRDKFKILPFPKQVKCILMRFVQYNKCKTAESFLKWISLSDEEIKKLKRDIIYSDLGMETCTNLISYEGKLEAVERFIAWWFSSEQDVKLFKKVFIFSGRVIYRCATLITENKFELLNEIIHFFVSSAEDIKELKKKIAYEFGYSICKKLISIYDAPFTKSNLHHSYGRKITEGKVYRGSKWEEVEKFINFCFSSEDEINDYKKNFLKNVLGKEIHYEFVALSKFGEAEAFFSWLGLSADEVKKLKKDTLFYYNDAQTMFIKLMRSKTNARFVFGNMSETIQFLLRWYLNDKDSVLEFRKHYKKWYQDFNYSDKAVALSYLDFIIEQRLKDFDKELD